jgi:hypothetical protein
VIFLDGQVRSSRVGGEKDSYFSDDVCSLGLLGCLRENYVGDSKTHIGMMKVLRVICAQVLSRWSKYRPTSDFYITHIITRFLMMSTHAMRRTEPQAEPQSDARYHRTANCADSASVRAVNGNDRYSTDGPSTFCNSTIFRHRSLRIYVNSKWPAAHCCYQYHTAST